MDTQTTDTIEHCVSDRPCQLHVDWSLYAQYLDTSDASDAEKRALIETVWSIVVGFVDLGFGIAPEQVALDARIRDHGPRPDFAAASDAHDNHEENDQEDSHAL